MVISTQILYLKRRKRVGQQKEKERETMNKEKENCCLSNSPPTPYNIFVSFL